MGYGTLLSGRLSAFGAIRRPLRPIACGDTASRARLSLPRCGERNGHYWKIMATVQERVYAEQYVGTAQEGV